MHTKKYYITTTLPYVNADPHIGFALEIIQADTLARFKRISGYDVFFNFGTDEHGLKIYQKAVEQNKDPKAYCDEYSKKFDNLKIALNLSYNNFIRTTDKYHVSAAVEFWRLCTKNGDIYKKNYKTKYCVGCELEKTDSELVDGRCPLHPNRSMEIFDEENYFFCFSKYQKQLLDLYQQHPNLVIPEFKLNEIKLFVKQGLVDFSISRLKSKMPWGIDVPDDPSQVMYVWFDALINYISAIKWPSNMNFFNSWWPVVQIAGKDNLRQQSAIWQAMLMSAGLPPSKQIYIHGFISVEGQKISKSLGNIINPYMLVKKYGTDTVRYYLLREIPSYSDGDYSERRFKELYLADLANGLGNLVSRIAKLAEKSNMFFPAYNPTKFDPEIEKSLSVYRFDHALEHIWKIIAKTDKLLDDQQPWKKTGESLKNILYLLISQIRMIAYNLQPFMPETADKILKQFSGPAIKSNPPLFPRLS